MNKLWLIIKREYLVRVRKKTFLLITLLTPLAMGALIAFSAYVTDKSNNFEKNILVKDDSGIFQKHEEESSSLTFTFSDEEYASLKTSYIDSGYDMLLRIPPYDTIDGQQHNIEYLTQDKLGLATISNIEKHVGKSFKSYMIASSNIDKAVYDKLSIDIDLENAAITDPDAKANDKTSKLSTIIGTVLGFIMGFLMYMVIFVYGGMVMRSVMEEKINRIVEVMISSVKPTQLMLGKIIGVGGVGLTQLAIWLILIPVILIGVQHFFGVSQDPAELQELSGQMGAVASEMEGMDINKIIMEIKNMNWFLIIPVFVIYFFGGYFIYSALFAAVGSAIGDDMGEGQQLMFPIVVLVVLAIVLLQPVLQDPNSTLAVFASIFPFFSPIIMPARLAFDPPMWQVALSIILLFLSSVFIAWVAGRIYRVGILMYGKKVNFKEITKWLFYKS